MSTTNLDKPLNILFLPAWYPTDQRPVLGTFIQEQAKAVSRYHNVTVLHANLTESGPRGRWHIASDTFEEGVRTVRIQWRKLPVPKTVLLFHLWVIVAAYRQLLKTGFEPHIIHAHNYSMALPALVLGKLYRNPVVIAEYSSQFPRGLVRRQRILDVRNRFRRATMILPVSAFLQESMQSYGIVGNYRVIHSPYDTKVFFPPTEGIDREAGSHIPRLLTVGLLTEPKGIPDLLRAVHSVKRTGKSFHLDIVGDGAERPEYEKMSADLGLQAVVTFQGMKNKAEVAQFMRRCDFYLQPSLWETFGTTVVEAMACGKPVVATRIPVFEEKIGASTGILVPVGDDVALAAAIETMLDRYDTFDPDQIAEHARRQYSHEAVGKMLSDVYREVQRLR